MVKGLTLVLVFSLGWAPLAGAARAPEAAPAAIVAPGPAAS